MIRGKTTFVCPGCGHVFESWDIEDNASVRTAPASCPRCGTLSPKAGMIDRIKTLFK